MNISKIKSNLMKKQGRIYHNFQVNFAYNSNKIEGGKLTEDETEEIFTTNSFIPKSEKAVKLDDLIEMKNHFRLFDYCLDIVDNKLTKIIMIEMHKILKRNTSEEDNPRYNVNGFKIIPNKIGLINIIETSNPESVEKDLDNLLEWYNAINKITIEDIIEFHYRFEKIHPFADVNGSLVKNATYPHNAYKLGFSN